MLKLREWLFQLLVWLNLNNVDLNLEYEENLRIVIKTCKMLSEYTVFLLKL